MQPRGELLLHLCALTERAKDAMAQGSFHSGKELQWDRKLKVRTKLPRGVGELKLHYSRMEDFLRNFTGISWNPELGLKVISHVNPSLEASKANRTVKLNQAKQSFRSSPLPFQFTIKRILHRQEYILLQYSAA
jgi:hypothetical protein